MNGRNAFLAVALLLVAGGIAAATGPNVVLVLVDDAGYGDLSCHGNPTLKTPNIDKLYGQSIRLTDFHVAPMCTPTRGQLLTGIDCLRNGAMNVSSGRTFLRMGIPTLASRFVASGYRTGQFGKWHLGDNFPYRPQDRQFQQAMWFPSSHIPSAPDHWRNSYFDTWFRHEDGEIRQSKGYITDVLFDAAMHWIAERKAADQPFFCYLPLNSAHTPHLVPGKYEEMYSGQPADVARFFGMMANIDENMGRLTAMLDEQGLADNTMLIYMTDNGATNGAQVFNAGMRGGKTTLYDGGHRVPCFIRWPGGSLGQPRDIDQLTEAQDILPTLAEFCDLKVFDQPPIDGVSLAGLLRGTEPMLADRMLVVQYSRMNPQPPAKGDAAVLWNKWRLVKDAELYDVAADPAQTHNVAAEHPDVVEKMREHYNRWWAEIEPSVNQFSAISVGTPAENPTLLSPADWADTFLDQSGQVRDGMQANGLWHITVGRAGTYEIRLRRWPEESHLALAAGDIPRPLADVPPDSGAAAGPPKPGKALPIARARLRVGDQDQALDVDSADQAAVFRLKLDAGRTRLQTWFYDSAGRELCGAYFVYVERK